MWFSVSPCRWLRRSLLGLDDKRVTYALFPKLHGLCPDCGLVELLVRWRKLRRELLTYYFQRPNWPLLL